MIEILKGNLLSTSADVICQQVNCRNVMNSGLAKTIYTKYPVVKELYHKFCNEHNDPYSLLGKVQIIRHNKIPYEIANIFGQLDYSEAKDMRYTNYGALEAAFTDINDRYGYTGRMIAFPYGFGCGLGGGDWKIVYELITYYLRDCFVKIYKQDVM